MTPRPTRLAAWCIFNIASLTEAFADLDRAIEIAPTFPDAYFNRGSAYLEVEDFRQSVADLDRAIELNPSDAVAYFNRALAYSGLGNLEQAATDCDRAIELDLDLAFACQDVVNRPLA